MLNSLNNQKTIEAIRKQFHIIANSPPKYDPFTSEGHQSWDNWTETCRDIESQLRGLGEVLWPLAIFAEMTSKREQCYV
jgi:hypothetical protein